MPCGRCLLRESRSQRLADELVRVLDRKLQQLARSGSRIDAIE